MGGSEHLIDGALIPRAIRFAARELKQYGAADKTGYSASDTGEYIYRLIMFSSNKDK